MNTDRADHSSSDDGGQSVTSTTSSSEDDDLAWDNYSPPLHTCTDECSCYTPSASQCTSCGRLTSCHSCVGGPCSSFKSWPDSKVPSSRDRSFASSSSCAWPISRGCVRREEADNQSTGDDLKSMESASCSRASRLVSASQDGIIEASVVLSGKPSSASIDFRRKCTAYWDGVRSLQSLASSTGCPTETTTAADTCTSAYSLLSLPNSSSSQQSALRIYRSIRASDGTVQVDRISLARTLRPHSADDIFRLRITSDQKKLSPNDDRPSGHRTKRICSAVQFSQVVTNHCYDNELSYYTALPGRDCRAITHSDSEDDEDRRRKINVEDDACNRHCKDLKISEDNEEYEHTGDTDYVNNGHRHRHRSSHGHHSKQRRDQSQNTRQQKDRDQQSEECVDHSREPCSCSLNATDHIEDNLHYPDPVYCSQSCRDNSDQSHHSRNHTDSLHHTCRGHHFSDHKLTDQCPDSKDQHRHVHPVKEHDDHCHGSRDQNEYGNRKIDHSEDHYDQRHHSRDYTDSKKSCGKECLCRNDIDSRHDLTDCCCHHVKECSDPCRDSKEHIDREHHSSEHSDRFHAARGQNDQRKDNWPCCCDSKDKTGHGHHIPDLENSSHDLRDQNVHAFRNSYSSRDNIEHESQCKLHCDDMHRFGNLDHECTLNRRDSDCRSSDRQCFDSYCIDQSCFKDCTCKKNPTERQGHKPWCYKKVRDSELTCVPETDNDQDKDHVRRQDNECGCFGPLNDSEGPFQDQRDQQHSNGAIGKKDISMDEIRKDPSFRNWKDLESYRTSFNSDTEFDLDDYIKDLQRRRSRFLETTGFYQDFITYKEEQESEEKKRNKKKNASRENEVCEKKVEAMCEADNECKIDGITNSLISRSTKACEDIQPECHAEERHIDVDVKFCEYPEAIPPLAYFLGRATVSIEGDLDELPRNTSPLIYKPQPLPVRNSTPEPATEMFPIAPIPEAQSMQGFEPRLELPPQSQQTPSRISAQVTPLIVITPPAAYVPERLPRTPVMAFKSTVEGDRKPTSIRGKAENMPMVVRFSPMQMGDLADIGHIEPVSKKQSGGLKPELVGSKLQTIASIMQNRFVVNERKMSNKTVGWVEQAAPIPPIDPGSAVYTSQDRYPSISQDRYPSISQDRYPSIDPRTTPQGMSPSAENRRPSDPPGNRISSVPAKSPPRSILVGNRVPEGNRVSSVPRGSRLSSFPYDGRLSSYDRSNSYADPDPSETSVGPADARYSIIPNFDKNRHSFGYSHQNHAVHLHRQLNLNPYGLIITHFNPQPQILVAAPKLAHEDLFYLDPSMTGVEIVPAIDDITVQIPSVTAPLLPAKPTIPAIPSDAAKPPKPPKPPKPAKCDDSDLTCLKELLAVPLSGQNNSDSDISAGSNGQPCKASSRSSDPGFDTSTGGVPFSQPLTSSKRSLLGVYPSENCLCTSVTQVVSRSMKHGTSGESDTSCAAVRDKRSSSYRNKWYRSLSSKTIHDISSEGSIADRNSSTSEARSDTCRSNRTSTWVDCFPGSEMRRPTKRCTNHLLDADEYGEEMQETSSCTDSVTTIYTRLPTSSAHRRSLNRCTLETEPCRENCFTSSARRCEEFEQRPVARNCRQSSPVAAKVSCAHCCPPAGDRIISSTVVASRRQRRCKADEWKDDGLEREKTFERKYKALKRFCIETLGCVPPPAASMRFE